MGRSRLERNESDNGIEWLTATMLSRRLADVLDAVQYEDRSFRIARRGRLVAVLSPSQAPIDEAPAGPRPELDEVQRRVLEAVASSRGPRWGYDSSMVGGDSILLERVLLRLEMLGLVDSDLSGYWATAAGRRLGQASGGPSE